jgi:hypothetical protein
MRSDRNRKHRLAKRQWGSGVSVGAVGARLAAMSRPALRTAQILLLVVTVGFIACLALLASQWERKWPRWLQWLGQGGDWVPVVLVTAVIALLCISTYRLRRNRSSAAVPVIIVTGLTAISVVLGLSSYWRCSNEQNPTFITPLLWTVSLVKGGIGDQSLSKGGPCPGMTPTALEVARLTIVAAIFISLVGVVATAFRAQSDRLRAAWARSVTVVVDLDDDSASMIRPIARTLRPKSTLVLMTDNPDQGWVAGARRQGARIVQVDFDRPEKIVAHRFWHRLNRLYLLSADPSTNLLRLSVISRRLAPMFTRRRVPLIVRIDDPWLAEAWRAQQFGQHATGSDHLWAADTASKYEVTARRLIDQILDNEAVRRLIVCGTSQLTLALCAEMALRHTERRFHAAEGQPELPKLTLVAPDADEYARDHAARHQRKGLGSDPPPVDAVTAVPSAAEVSGLVEQTEDENATTAVIVVDSAAAADPILGTRLAARYPTMPIYMWDPAARLNTERLPVAGELRTYRLGMELPDGHAHDNFERAAMLIHERFASSQADRTEPASLPWEMLSDFYKGSNRRQLVNALWMVEKIAGHTWRTGDRPPDHVSPESLRELDAVGDGETTSPDDPAEVAVKKLERLGFSEDTIYAMAQADWERWSHYLRDRGWTWGPERSTKNKRHERLVDSWDATLADPTLKGIVLKSLADAQVALAKLKRLGFSEDTAYAMAKAEWQDWSGYLRKHGWTLGDKRHESKKKHEKLVDDWEATVVDPELKAAALKSLAGTVIELMQLGYRSRPMWETYERAGTLTAKRRRTRWKWTTAAGKPVPVPAGDWEVCDSGRSWPVRNDIFHASYRHKHGNHWERRGKVLVRPARPGETIHTLEGTVPASDGDWVIQGNRGEQWPVPHDEFRRRYRGPVPVYGGSNVPTTTFAVKGCGTDHGNAAGEVDQDDTRRTGPHSPSQGER